MFIHRTAFVGIFIIGLLAVACSAPRQKADLKFDTSVANPAYRDEHPAVLFDEAHHNIHTTKGLYKPFVNLVTNDGYVVTPNRAPFSQSVLQPYRILVIANALGTNESNDAPAFSDAECDAVAAWVKNGGSLLLITDHAPTGSAAEPLASRFGIEMSKGIVEDPKNSDAVSGDSSQLVFSRENGLLGNHAIMTGRSAGERLARVMTFTGQALRGPEGATELMPLADSAVLRAPHISVEKSGSDTRVTITYGDAVPARGYAQGLALRYGNGRVVVLGEAAMFTAQIDGRTKRPFGMNAGQIGNRQMALNTMHWLSGLL